MSSTDLFYRFGVAMIIGILVGLQREHSYTDHDRELFAGVRTFALIGLVGCAAALLAESMDSPWPFVAIALIMGALIVVAYYIEAVGGGLGTTTEFAAVLTFLSGALCYWDYVAVAVAVSVAMAVLLSLKPELRNFVSHLTREDIYATLKFAVITAIVLPILPNQAYGPEPFNVLNPYKIWLMVVFISGISFLGYILIKAVGTHRGIELTGFLGGIASSTAVTMSLSQRSKTHPKLSIPFALAVLIAWTVMFVRVIFVVWTLNADLFRVVSLPLLALTATGVFYGVYLYLKYRVDQKEDTDFKNPFELWPAIRFGLLYALILLLSKAARVYLGDTGVYLSSVVAGFLDVDAVVLSMIELSGVPGGVSTSVAARAVVLAAISNTLFKGGFALLNGSLALRKVLGLALGAIVGVGVIVFIAL